MSGNDRAGFGRKAAAAVAILLVTALGWHILSGFFRPDPYVLEKGRAMKLLLLALQSAVVLGVAAAIAVIVLWARRKLQPLYLLLMLFAVIAAVLLGYPAAEYLYQRSYARQIEKFHPYLQLTPHTVALRRPAGEGLSILCLGGSTTEFADGEKKGWVGRLDRLLKEKHPDVEVYNGGRQWYTTQHTLINYLLNMRSLKPDMIVLMQSVNDMLINADFAYISAADFRGDYGHFHGPVNRIIRRKSLPDFVFEMIGGMWNHTPREQVTRSELPGLESFSRNVRTLMEIAALDGTSVVLMSEPSLFKNEMSQDELKALHLINYESVGATRRWAPAAGLDGMQRYNQQMRALAEAHGVPFIDLDALVPKSLEYFYDEVHYRLPGYDRVAEAVASALVNGELLRKGSAVPRFHGARNQ